ncbi:hypothetical protein D3C87_1595350 [compost metagenome]
MVSALYFDQKNLYSKPPLSAGLNGTPPSTVAVKIPSPALFSITDGFKLFELHEIGCVIANFITILLGCVKLSKDSITEQPALLAANR